MKIEYLIVFALIIVVALIFISSNNGAKTQTTTIDGYVSTLESKLEKSLSKVKGCGKVEVIISVKSGMQQVLATEKTEKNGEWIESPVLVNGKTVSLSENYPEIIGVIVVSEGANNLGVKVNLINAVSVYLNVDESKIEILAMN